MDANMDANTDAKQAFRTPADTLSRETRVLSLALLEPVSVN
jgi:hypothetical protein